MEMARKRFRRKVLESDYALCQVVDMLQRVHIGDLPFNRTVKVSLTENFEKDRILKRMPRNLQSLEQFLMLNVEEFNRSLDDRINEEERRRVRRSITVRRRKAVTLVEELSIRTQKVQPLMKKLEQISWRMDELEISIARLKSMHSAREGRAKLEKELRDLMFMTLEDALSLHRRVAAVKTHFRAYEQVKRTLSEMVHDKIELVLKTLTYREREIIKLRSGLGDGYTYTLGEVARIFKVTRKCVRAIEAKAARKLQHPIRFRHLAGFLDMLDCLPASRRLGRLLLRPPTAEEQGILDMQVSDLDLSVRTTNSLESEGITTLRDLVARHQQDLLEIRNFDKTSLNEVREKLRQLGLALPT